MKNKKIVKAKKALNENLFIVNRVSPSCYCILVIVFKVY